MSKRLNNLNLENICRTCLSDKGQMRSIFMDCLGLEFQNIKIVKMIESCTSLKLKENDGLPNLICSNCLSMLNHAFNFQQLCHKTDITLRKFIQTGSLNNFKEDETEDNYLIVQIENEENNEYVNEIEITESVKNEVKAEGSTEDSNNSSNESNSLNHDSLQKTIIESRKKFYEKRECKICGFVSSNARGLSLHISHLHKNLKERWCSICIDEFDDLASHMTMHKTVRSYACKFCEKCYNSQSHLTEHILTHSLERPYMCRICNKGFISARHLKVHERIHSGEKPYVCKLCTKSFSQKGTLLSHIRLHTGFKPFHCKVCGKKCTTSGALTAHQKKTGHQSYIKEQEPSDLNINDFVAVDDNPTDEKSKDKDSELTTNGGDLLEKTEPQRKLCTVCGKTFSTASKLRLHMRVHTGETPYKCEYCNKRFSTRCQLVVHVRTHTGERPHVCHICGKGFAQSSVLNTHMKLHTGRPEQCTICDRRFCRPAELRLHMRKHTGEKPFLCTMCGTAFIQRSHLMEHIKTHSDERPFQCHLCERAFKQSSSLKSHIQIHMGHKPYKCSQCPYACRQPYSLTQHMRQHDVDAPQPNRPHVCLICQRNFSTMAMLTSHTRTAHNAVF